jgi:hypothetical protein
MDMTTKKTHKFQVFFMDDVRLQYSYDEKFIYQDRNHKVTSRRLTYEQILELDGMHFNDFVGPIRVFDEALHVSAAEYSGEEEENEDDDFGHELFSGDPL